MLLLSFACRRESAPSPAVVTGATLYAKYCALCHGANGEGYSADNAPSLISSTFRATVSEAFLRDAIAQGRPGTAMAGYAHSVGGPLSAEQLDQLIEFLRHDAPPTALPAPPPPGDATNGSLLYVTHCMECHGTPQQRATAVHLANPGFLASASDAYLRAAIERGRPGTRMEAWLNKLTPSEVADLVSYLRSIQRPAAPAIPVAPGTVPGLHPEPDPAAGFEKAPTLEGPIVINPQGKRPDFTLKEDLYVPVAQAGQAFKEKKRLVIIDARTPSDFLRLHIEGAISVPYYDMHELAKVPDDGTWVIAYCACPHHVSGVIIQELRKRGYKHTAVLDEGVFFWQQQGFPVVAAPGQLPVAAPPPPPGPVLRPHTP
jgi:cytochrome c oxidase cbb3-type subunit III